MKYFLVRILLKKSPPTGLASTTASGGLGLLKLNGSSPTHLQQLHECVDAWCSESYVQVYQCVHSTLYRLILLDTVFHG